VERICTERGIATSGREKMKTFAEQIASDPNVDPQFKKVMTITDEELTKIDEELTKRILANTQQLFDSLFPPALHVPSAVVDNSYYADRATELDAELELEDERDLPNPMELFSHLRATGRGV
jgi:hypothetical protein